MKNKLTYLNAVLAFIIVCTFSSCYKKYADADYPAQTIYMPAASNGIYSISSVAVPGQTYRYIVDQAASKFNVPLAVYRSGLYSKGELNVNIAVKTDTINNLISSGVLVNTKLLPASAYTVQPSATIPNGSDLRPFILSVDLNLLLNNPTTTYAIAFSISSPQVKTGINSVVVVTISPSFLIPTANFSSTVDPNTAKKYNFSNTSVNTVAYSWNFGDGTPAVTDSAPSHVYSASGSYTVTLTGIGAAGTINQSVKTATIVVP